MFAVIKTGGKQYVVSPDTTLRIEKITPDKNGEVVFNEVLLMVDGDKVEIGNPIIKGAEVRAKVVKEGRARKIIILKYKAKKRYKKKMGHRQPYTEVLINSVKRN